MRSAIFFLAYLVFIAATESAGMFCDFETKKKLFKKQEKNRKLKKNDLSITDSNNCNY
jgi:hypothetical protein